MTGHPTPADRLAAAVLAPVQNDDQRATMDEHLRGQLAPHAAGNGDKLDEIAARIGRADRLPWPLRRWQMLLTILMLAVSAPLVFWAGASAVRSVGGLRILWQEPGVKAEGGSGHPALSSEARLVLHGAPGAATPADRWRPLWENAPDNPAFLAKYALGSWQTDQRLAPEIVATARRIDPDNGWFIALEAAAEARHAVTAGKLSEKDAKAGKARPITTNDGAALDRAMALLREARGKPRFDSYQTELHRGRMAVVPRPEDFISSLTAFAAAVDTDEPLLPLRDLAYALSARAEQCGRSGDATGFDETLALSRWLWQTSLRESDTLVGQLLGKAMATMQLRHFRDAATALGRDGQAATFAAVDQSQRELRERLRTSRARDALSDLLTQRGAITVKLSTATGASLVQEPPDIREDDLKPGRLVEHALVDRMFTGLTWVILGVCAWTAAFGKPRLRPLATRLTLLLGWRDWCWIVLAGVLAPVAWFVVVTRCTPLSAREWSVMMTQGLQPAGQHLALRLLLLLVPLTLARHLLGRRGAGLGLAGPRLTLDWLAIVLAALAVPAFGLVGWWLRSVPAVVAVALVFLGLPLLWLLVLAVKFAFASRPQALRRATVGAAVAPAWVSAMLLCGLALPVHQAEECHWVRADQLFGTFPDLPVVHRYEALLVERLRAETTELLAPLQETALERD